MNTTAHKAVHNLNSDQRNYRKALTAWLAKYPQIGELTSGKFYYIVDGEPVYIEAFTEL